MLTSWSSASVLQYALSTTYVLDVKNGMQLILIAMNEGLGGGGGGLEMRCEGSEHSGHR